MKRILLVFIFLIVVSLKFFGQVTRVASDYNSLNTAIVNSTNGDIINITSNIIVTNKVLINKSVTIRGNGYFISVPINGVSDEGVNNSSASAFRVFETSSSANVTVTIENCTIKGGGGSTGSGLPGQCILNNSGNTIRLTNVTLSNGRNPFVENGTLGTGGGGAFFNYGTAYFNRCRLIRNSATYGGGFMNWTGAVMVVENSTFAENRSESSGGGGGAGENRGTIYINNSTFSNNKSTEIGGALNNFGGSFWVLNSTFSGNVAYGNGGYGGAIGHRQWSSTVATGTIINSLFAYNYRATSGGPSAPSVYVLDDLGTYASNSSGNQISAYYCILHTTPPTNVLSSVNVLYNKTYSGLQDGSDNTLFSGGILTKITDATGTEIGTANVFQPYLVSTNGNSLPTLKTGSYALNSSNRGCETGFSLNSFDPIIGYKNMTTNTWVDLRKTNASSSVVLTDQVGVTRNTVPAIGSVESPVDNVYMVKVLKATNGTVNGGSLYGDVYTAGTRISVTAIPSSGYQFSKWNDASGNQLTTSNPFEFTVNSSITIIPVFTASAGSSYTITYSGNSNISGSAPAATIQSSSTTILGKNTLHKSGYKFMGWNTQPNGSGTDYTVGSTYSTGTNLNLFAKWIRNYWTGTTSTSASVTSNWEAGALPDSDEDVVFHPSASNDIVLVSNTTIKAIDFNGSNKKVDVGNFELTLTTASEGSATNYIKVNGTGKVKIPISNGLSVEFPVGNSTYNPVTIKNNTGASDDFSVTIIDNVYANGISGALQSGGYIKRTWDIQKTNNNSGSGIDLSFKWNSGEETMAITTPALFHYENNRWNKEVSGTTTSTLNSLSYVGYTGGFSPFSIMESSISLPVVWMGFSGEKLNSGFIKLEWSTASEINAKDYIIQHSKNGISWSSIGNVLANGNTNLKSTYNFTHDSPLNGLNYYRLVQRDLDGKAYYSKIINLLISNPNFNVYPNPVYNGVSYINSAKGEFLNIFDNSGRFVKKVYLKAGINKIDVASLKKGVYYLKSDNHQASLIIQ